MTYVTRFRAKTIRGSTFGGFLIGFGLIMLLAALGASYVVEIYYAPLYKHVVEIAPILNTAADFLATLDNFGQSYIVQVAVPLSVLCGYDVQGMLTQLHSARVDVETARNIVNVMMQYPPEILGQWVIIIAIVSLIMIISGMALASRSRTMYEAIYVPRE